MMKIGIRPDTYDYCGDGRYLKMREHGYSCADYVMVNTDTPVYQCSEEEFEAAILREKELADVAGIEITQVHGPFRMPPKDFEFKDRAEHMEKMKRSIRATALLQCKYWVIHPLMPYGTEDAGSLQEEKTWDVNLNFMRELLKTAKEYGVTICLENMPFKNFSMATPKAVYNFVREMNDSNFKMCLDTGHANVIEGVNPAEVIREYKDAIRVLHIHDNNGKMDLHRFPYWGTIDWKDFYSALKEIDFKGDFSLETEPSRKLPIPIYEQMCIILMQIVEDIMDDDVGA